MKLKIKLFLFILYFISIYKIFFNDILGNISTSIIDLLLDGILIGLGFSVFRDAPIILRRVIVILFLITIIGCFANSTHLVTYLNGVREILLFPSVLLFLFSVFRSAYSKYVFKKMVSFYLFFLIVQIPASFFQYRSYGAGDMVGGTLSVGNSGILTISIFVIIFCLASIKSRFASKSRMQALLPYLVFLLPCALNETKITFLLLPVFLVSFVEVKKIRGVLTSVLVTGVLMTIAAVLYKDRDKEVSNPISHIFNAEFLEYYLLTDEEAIDIPRFSKIVYATKLLKEDSVNALFGFEYGAFKGGSLVTPSLFASKFNWLLIGSRPYCFYLLISGGIILFLLMSYLLFYSISVSPYVTNLDLFQGLFYFLIILIVMFYNDSFRDRFFVLIFLSSQFILRFTNLIMMRKYVYVSKR